MLPSPTGLIASRVALGFLPVVSVLALSGTGCQLAYFGVSNRQEPIRAEYGQLIDKTVAVVVWADQSTLDMDPYARHRVAKAVKYYMEASMPKTKFVDPADVAEWQDRLGAAWESQPIAAACKELKCDRIVRVDILEYTTRVRTARALRKGRITGTLNVYGTDDETGWLSLYSAEVSAMYPPEASTKVVDMSDGEVRRQTVEQFGGMVARKFYDHEVPYTRTTVR